MGYGPSATPALHTKRQQPLRALGAAMLTETVVVLDEVRITGRKDASVSTPDRSAYSVDQDLMSKSQVRGGDQTQRVQCSGKEFRFYERCLAALGGGIRSTTNGARHGHNVAWRGGEFPTWRCWQDHLPSRPNTRVRYFSKSASSLSFVRAPIAMHCSRCRDAL
jgi:hypothetical protein